MFFGAICFLLKNRNLILRVCLAHCVNLPMNIPTPPLSVQRLYVATMMDVIARGLVAASAVDPVIQQEIAGFAPGMVLEMMVMPNGQRLVMQVGDDHRLTRLHDFVGRPDLSIKFKHVSLAFLVFSFQESTSRAFANDRMIADGDVAHAIRLVRCLDRMEALILPRLIAERAVKRYPDALGLSEKIGTAARIYAGVVASVVKPLLTKA